MDRRGKADDGGVGVNRVHEDAFRTGWPDAGNSKAPCYLASMRLLALLLILFTASARAGDGPLMSAHMMLPVVISGNKVSLESFVIRPDRPGKFPLVVITHGMPHGFGEEFFTALLNSSPVGYTKAAVAFAQRGYAVVSIMRRGYGRSGEGSPSLRGRPATIFRPCALPATISLRRSLHCAMSPGSTLSMSSCSVIPLGGSR